MASIGISDILSSDRLQVVESDDYGFDFELQDGSIRRVMTGDEMPENVVGNFQFNIPIHEYVDLFKKEMIFVITTCGEWRQCCEEIMKMTDYDATQINNSIYRKLLKKKKDMNRIYQKHVEGNKCFSARWGQISSDCVLLASYAKIKKKKKILGLTTLPAPEKNMFESMCFVI